MPKDARRSTSCPVKSVTSVAVGDIVWFPKQRVNTIPIGTVAPSILKGKIEHIEPVHGTTCLISFEVFGEKYFSTIVTRSLWHTKKALIDYTRSLNDFQPGDLVHVAQNQYDKSTGLYSGMSTVSGIVIKSSKQSAFLQVQTESGAITAHRDYCIVLSRNLDTEA